MIKITNERSASGMLEHSYGEVITARGIQAIAADCNYGWATAGARIGGLSWPDGLDFPEGDDFVVPTNIMFRPSRAEDRGLTGYARVDVWIESEGAMSWSGEVRRWTSGPTPESFASSTDNPGGRRWSQMSFTLPVVGVEVYKFQLISLALEVGCKVYSVQVIETPYINLESIIEPVAAGDFHIGPYFDTEQIYAWSSGTGDPYSSMMGLEAYPAVNEIFFQQDKPTSGVNSVQIGSAGYMRSTGHIGMLQHQHAIVACAMRLPLANTGWVMQVRGPIGIVRYGTNTLRIIKHPYPTGAENYYLALTDAGDGTSGWFDLVIHCTDTQWAVYLDGQKIHSAVSAGNNETLQYLRCEGAGNEFAMPAFIVSDEITEADALKYIDYRRHVHGIF